MSANAAINIENHENAVIVTFRGDRVEYEDSGKLRSQTMEAARENPGLPVIVDLSGVIMLPSVSIGALITISQLLKESGQRLILAGLSPDVRQTLAICRLDKIFDIRPTRDDALEALQL